MCAPSLTFTGSSRSNALPGTPARWRHRAVGMRLPGRQAPAGWKLGGYWVRTGCVLGGYVVGTWALVYMRNKESSKIGVAWSPRVRMRQGGRGGSRVAGWGVEAATDPCLDSQPEKRVSSFSTQGIKALALAVAHHVPPNRPRLTLRPPQVPPPCLLCIPTPPPPLPHATLLSLLPPSRPL